MIINLAFLNATNGMFWYSVDKIRSIGQKEYVILASPKISSVLKAQFPDKKIRETGKLHASIIIVYNYIINNKKNKIITFTSHPFPFLKKQTIAFYDDFPFIGRLGIFKKFLFKLAVKTSNCRIGIINRSRSLPFLYECGVLPSRIFFDSAFPSVDNCNLKPRRAYPASPLQIGLVGTDSLKKDYDTLFAKIIKLGYATEVSLCVFGTVNEYYQNLCDKYPELKIRIIDSDRFGISDFFDDIDYLVSVSLTEGYGRPMGLAAALGIPLFLIKSDVFIEFFDGSASFFDNIEELLNFLIIHRPATTSQKTAELHKTDAVSPFFQ